MRRRYDVRAFLGVVPGRVAYAVDPEGVIRWARPSQLFPRRHVEGALEAVREMDS